MADNDVKVEAEVKTPSKKKFNKNSIVWCVCILVIIGSVAGALLGAINVVTYVDPDEAIISKITGIYESATDIKKDDSYVINGGAYGSVTSVFTYNVDGDDMLCYYAVGRGAYDGTIELLFFVMAEEGIVDNVSVYSSGETSAVGGKVLKVLDELRGFELKSIENYGQTNSADAQEMEYYVSGATVTTKGVTNALRACAYAYNNKVEG